MGLKVAISGKGGVGKTTIAGMIARSWGRVGMNVLAVDADPVNHLAGILGLPRERYPTPISGMSDLIEERTGVPPGDSFGKLFRMNPAVDDIPDRFAARCEDNVKLLVLGTIDSASSGCFCPENALLRSLLDHIVLRATDHIVIDMEAGLEHLGRGSSRGIDLLIIVVEEGQRSIETAFRIRDLASELGIGRIAAILNRATDGSAVEAVESMLRDGVLDLLGHVPYDIHIKEADLKGISPFSYADDSPAISAVSEIAKRLLDSSLGT